MAETFDPYHKWLGIKPHEQPPNAYRLLGVDLFEPDPDVIEAAAEQRLAFLQTVATGPHAEWSQRLMNEVEQARMCLLNPQRRALYDQQLQAYLAALAQQRQWSAAGAAYSPPAGYAYAAPATNTPITATPSPPGANVPTGLTPPAGSAGFPPAERQNDPRAALPGTPHPSWPDPRGSAGAATAFPAGTPEGRAPAAGPSGAVGPAPSVTRRRLRRRRAIPLWASFLLAMGATAVGLWGIYFALSNNRPAYSRGADARTASDSKKADDSSRATPSSRKGVTPPPGSGAPSPSEPIGMATPGEEPLDPVPPIGKDPAMAAPGTASGSTGGSDPVGQPPAANPVHWLRRVADLKGHEAAVRGLVVSPAGDLAVSIGEDRTIRLWDTERQGLVALIRATERLGAVSLSADGRWSAVGMGEHILLIDIQQKKQVQSMEGHRAPVTVIRFAPDSRRFVSGSEDGTARLWKLDQQIEVNGLPGPRPPIRALAVFPDGQQAVVADDSGKLSFWKLDENVPKRELTVSEPVRDLRFSGDGRTLLALTDRAILRWDTENWKEQPPLRAHAGDGPRLVAFTPWSPDANQLMVVDVLGGVHLLDAKDPANTRHAANDAGKVGRAAFCVAREWVLTAPPASAAPDADGSGERSAMEQSLAAGTITLWHWEFGVPEVRQTAKADPWTILVQPAGPPIAPLAFIDLATSVAAGDWSIEDHRIRVAPGEYARLTLPGDVPLHYLQEMTIEADAPLPPGSPNAATGEPDAARSAIAIVVPVHGRPATVLLDEQTAAGYRCRIAVGPGQSADAWQTPPYDQPLFGSKTPRTVEVLVQQQRLLVRVDDQTIFDVPADGPFAVPPQWQVQDPEVVTLGAHRRAVAFGGIKRIPVKPAAVEP